MTVVLQDAPFDAARLLTEFQKVQSGAGAVVTFSGIVRDTEHGLKTMDIEHYPGMTQSALQDIRDQAVTRFSLTGALVVHRYGRLSVGEQIMMVATAAAHRKSAFDGAEYLMDYLKSRAPFWKKEITDAGETWVDAKGSDEDALGRWST